MQTNQNKTILRLTESGILLAIGILLDTFLKFDATWLYGGSITACSMLPLVIIAYKYGVAWGSLSGVVHGLITMMISGGRAGGLAAMIEDKGGVQIFIWILLLDYILAFGAIGLAGFAPKFTKTIPSSLMLGAVFGLVGRYIFHVLSGFLLFGSYAEWFFGEAVTWGGWFLENLHGQVLYLVYSLIYNGLYMVPEIIITAVGGLLIGNALKSQLIKNRTNPFIQ
ncbi:MAG: energy-coupled thiamine transporter ThiT [Candidatus Merdivicinus sp.]